MLSKSPVLRLRHQLFCCLIYFAALTSGFIVVSPRTRRTGGASSLLVLQDQETDIAHHTETAESSIWKWNASGSFGSLLMQMQRKEEALRANNESLELQALNLDEFARNQTMRQEEQERPVPTAPAATVDYDDDVRSMDWETAKELDEAVIQLIDSDPDALVADVEVLPLNSLYQAQQEQAATSGTDQKVTSTPAIKRIERDLRHLAVAVSSNVESVGQWRLFCQERGGLFPLLETIREGAKALSPQEQDDDEAWSSWWVNRQEESFLAACNACRSLRDLCAVSPELASVITDGILRANAQADEGGALLQDLTTMLEHANNYADTSTTDGSGFRIRRRKRRDSRRRAKLYVTQLLLAMSTASDNAITAIRAAPGLSDAIVACSSYARKEQTRRWLRYPGEVIKYVWKRSIVRRRRGAQQQQTRPPFLEAANLANDLNGQVQRTANQVLAAIGCNHWVPKLPGQRGLRILCLDGGGSRGMAAVTALYKLMSYVGDGAEVADSFDIVAGTSTGGIIAFLTALRSETSAQAMERYNQLIKQIFVKSALSTPRMVFTTASYDESYFMDILSDILGDYTMLDSRSDPRIPYVFCIASKMSSTPTHVALFRNYNYARGELADHFTIDPDKARKELGLPLSLEHDAVQSASYKRKEIASDHSPGVKLTTDASRHPGSFRLLQRYALRASTAAPTFFKPVMMSGEMYCDGGIVASNPAAVAIHEARTLFPQIPIEMVVSIGTGGFLEQKTAPRIGWDGILGQIVGSACDGEQIHHILEDILGDPSVLGKGRSISKTRYYRFNPVLGLPDEYPIDVTEPDKLEKMRRITREYMDSPVQRAKMDEISRIIKGGKSRWWTPRRRRKKKKQTSGSSAAGR